ncbi:MAG: ABC transporter permease [Cetobacterium sp.]
MKNIIITLSIFLLGIVSIFLGVAKVNLSDILIEGTNSNNIIFLSRVPRTISIVVAGFGMSICGLIMQQLTMNKFVSPTTAGTADSSKLGILVALLFFPRESTIFKMLIGTAFALGGTFLFLGIVRKIKIKDNALVPLIGMMISGVLSSLTMFFAYKGDYIQSVNSWMFGDFSGVLKGNYELLYITVPLVLTAFFYSKQFTISGMGEEFAVNLGINYKMIVNIGLALVSVISSLVMITIGGIPFLGLIIPNIISMFFGDNLSKNLYITGALGSAFLLLCDILGRVAIYPHEIPIGMITGVVGSGVFLMMIFRRLSFEE